MVVICVKCYAEFATARDLERHLDRKVPCDAGEHTCAGCCLNYKTKKSLQDHQKRCKGKTSALQVKELTMQLQNATGEHTAGTSVPNLQQTSVELQMAATDVVPQECAITSVQNRISEDSLIAVADLASTSRTVIDDPDCYKLGDRRIRKTSECPQRVSVYDLIAAMTDDKNPRTTFMRLQTDYPENVAGCSNYKFPGRGNQTSPATDARGAVMIMNLLPGHKAAQFRVACADIIVRYLGGDETLVGEIQRNRVLQETAAETNPVRLFGDAVNSAQFCDTGSVLIESGTEVREYRAPQFYLRQVFGKWSHVHPVGRPQDVLSADQLAEFAVVKIGSQGVTERQLTHNKQFDRSELLDSCLTSSFTHVETKAKDYWRDHDELYEGLHEDKTARDTELLLVRNQEDYERYLAVVQQLCERFPYIPDKRMDDTPIELRLAQEKSKQSDADARKAEADARKVEASASAEARIAEAEARKAEAEANARRAEAEFEILKFKIAHGLQI